MTWDSVWTPFLPGFPSLACSPPAAATAAPSRVAPRFEDSRTCQTRPSGFLSLRACGGRPQSPGAAKLRELCWPLEGVATSVPTPHLHSPGGHEACAACLQSWNWGRARSTSFLVLGGPQALCSESCGWTGDLCDDRTWGALRLGCSMHIEEQSVGHPKSSESSCLVWGWATLG